MDKFSENMKKVILAGIGAAASTAEKSKDFLEEMVEKGELTVEQGKVLNEELKHNIRQKVREVTGRKDEGEGISDEDLSGILEKLTPEQLRALKEKLAAEEPAEEQAEAEEAEEAKDE
ncbi:MAG TPA: hypothetical protein H9799_08315 [Candidatus Mediterraneibacter merdipullorum]|nr:hypothetical protein [Candidatus Mediterraneibacter merdipullorum]